MRQARRNGLGPIEIGAEGGNEARGSQHYR
jgi:hypothetical protein